MKAFLSVCLCAWVLWSDLQTPTGRSVGVAQAYQTQLECVQAAREWARSLVKSGYQVSAVSTIVVNKARSEIWAYTCWPATVNYRDWR